MKTILWATMLLISATTFAEGPKNLTTAKTATECNSSDPAANKICKAKHFRKGTAKHNSEMNKVGTENKPKI